MRWHCIWAAGASQTEVHFKWRSQLKSSVIKPATFCMVFLPVNHLLTSQSRSIKSSLLLCIPFVWACLWRQKCRTKLNKITYTQRLLSFCSYYRERNQFAHVLQYISQLFWLIHFKRSKSRQWRICRVLLDQRSQVKVGTYLLALLDFLDGSMIPSLYKRHKQFQYDALACQYKIFYIMVT